MGAAAKTRNFKRFAVREVVSKKVLDAGMRESEAAAYVNAYNSVVAEERRCEAVEAEIFVARKRVA